ncbi:MAG: D-alanyl-D-alanine carboxypeptidase family protein [Ruminococcus sp.]|nr:D-alanyl-D-alanine carboxypeptidase family protein [Ruminococcus sp.]
MEQHNSNRQNGRKRRKARYDRIIIALAIVLILLFLMGSCTCNCIQCVCAPSESGETSDKDKDKDKDEEKETDTSGTGSGVIPVPGAVHEAISVTAADEDVKKGTLVIVNQENEYTFPTGDVVLANVSESGNASYSVSDTGIQLDKTVVDNLNLFLSEFSTIFGTNDLQVTNGYRSKQDQHSRYSNGSSIFPGGYSDYHTARSFDLCIAPESGLTSYFVANGDYVWIDEHAADYGFILRYPDGKIDETGVNPRAYTFHYAGVPHSVYMYNNNLCMEEYVELLKSYPSTSPLTVDANGVSWTVFYVEASSGGTVINIPNHQEYTISGDNMGGFIVAYH